MQVLIFGAGVIGTTYAWQLQEAGCDVSLFVRKQRMTRFGHSGVSIAYSDMRGPKKEDGHTVFRPKVTDRLYPDKPFDLIIIAVRSNQWQDVIPYVAKYSGNADILFLGHVWDELGLADKHFPKGKYLLGFPEITSGGHIENGISCYLFENGHTMLGEPDGRSTERLKNIAGLMALARLQPAVSSKMKDWLQSRYVISAITPGLISKAGNARLFASNNTLIKQYILALKEGAKVCRKRGAERVSLFPFNKLFLPPFILKILIRRYLSEEVQSAMDAHMKHGAAEKKKQYYDVLKTGKRLKIPMPYWASFEKYMDFS